MTTSTLADWHPRVYNAIKWTAPNQGSRTIEYTTIQGITYVPIAYHGGVDWNASGDITASDIERFTNWVHQELPSDYCGPVVIDYEQPWRAELSTKTIAPDRLEEILSVYAQGVQVAREVIPNAQWGYWGFPLLRNTGKSWFEQGLTVKSLTDQCTALFPDVYDSNKADDGSKLAEKHITKVLELAAGQMPVYVFISPRFTGQGGDHSFFIPNERFLKQANAAMKAVWIDAKGVQHRIQGLVLWDSYGFSPESEWGDLDQKHKYYFQLLQALVKAWAKEMAETNIETCLSSTSFCQYALPEPSNSGSVLKDKNIKQPIEKQTEVRPEREQGRVRSGRVRGNRVEE
ncbi:hypothetical protein H8D29_06570 [PVC group bacterium]|nr:hypothetical protein [PVC group bacterium]